VDASRDERRTLLGALALIAAAVGASGLYAYAGSDFHGNQRAVSQLAMGATAAAVGAFVGYRRPRHPLGWLLLVAGFAVWVSFAGSSWIDWLLSHGTKNERLVRVLVHLATPGWIVYRGAFVALLPSVVPDGWVTPRSRVYAAVASVVIAITAIAHSRLWTPEYFQGLQPVGTARLAGRVEPWGHRAIWVCGAFALIDLVARYSQWAPDMRRRYRWLVGTTLVLLWPATVGVTADALGDLFRHTTSETVENWTTMALPAVLAIGILKHGLLDIRVIVRRATTYAALAVVAGTVYVAVVVGFGAVTEDGLGAGRVVATGLVAVIVVPAYARVQRAVDRVVFGSRGDPYKLVKELGARLDLAPGGEQALQLVTDTLREQLRLPYVAIELTVAGAAVVAAASGTAGEAVERFPLRHHGSELGALAVARRTAAEPFRAAERELLVTFAGQVGVIAHDAALAEALRRSRAMLLETREQERLRIRRDLHDGLGATLASVSLGLGAAADRLDGSDASLVQLLRDLEAELGVAVADIRRLVHDLRPPALDDLGLVDAVREHVRGLEAGGDVRFEVTAPATSPPLPPAVELAAYRVALEALTNVVRHANATTCWVRIKHEDALSVTVEDDGVGVTDAAVYGVGLPSMHERVLELGGTLGLCRREPRGTAVIATFPLNPAVAP
jgi:two-component system NarL family sensor kinase